MDTSGRDPTKVNPDVNTRKITRYGDIGWGVHLTETNFRSTFNVPAHRQPTISFADIPAEMKKEYLIEGINLKYDNLPAPIVESSNIMPRKHRTKGSGVSGFSDIEALNYSDGVSSTYNAFNRNVSTVSSRRDSELSSIFSTGNVSRFTNGSPATTGVWSPKTSLGATGRSSARWTGVVTRTSSSSTSGTGTSTPAHIGPIVPR